MAESNAERIPEVNRWRPREKLTIAPGFHIVTVGLELTEHDEQKLRAYALARFPRRPNGGLYLGKAASVLYHLGVKYVREEIGRHRDSPYLETIHGTVSQEELRQHGLRVVEIPTA